MATGLIDADTPIIPLEECRRFISDCLQAVGTPKQHADTHAKLLVEADYRGHYSHGMNRLVEMYVSEIRAGVCDPKALPQILKQTPSTAWVEGNNGLGSVIGNFCMDIAIEKAKRVGIGMVVCKGSNHYGIAGMYTLQAMKEGLIGFSCTNSSPAVAPTRTKHAALGTNPISLAASGVNGDSFVLDMATSTVAMGKIEMKKRTNTEIPSQWIEPETNALHPLGGDEANSSYKGYGLSVLVEILCGILGGGAYGPNIRVSTSFSKPADLGQCFIAIDPNCFSPGFETRLSDFMNTLRNMEPSDQEKPVWVAGDPERLHMKAVDAAGGVRYVKDQMDSCDMIASTLNVKPLQVNNK